MEISPQADFTCQFRAGFPWGGMGEHVNPDMLREAGVWLGSCLGCAACSGRSLQGFGVQQPVGCVRGAGVKIVLGELMMLELGIHLAQI